MYITNEMREVHFQTDRKEYARISLLQQYFLTEKNHKVRKFKKTGVIHSNVISGNFNMNADSDIRRTCSLDLLVTDSSFFIGKDKKIWLDKLFRVEVGIKSLKTNEIIWFDKGIFAIDSPKLSYSLTTKNLHIDGLDLMCTLNGKLGGVLEEDTIMEANEPISSAIAGVLTEIGMVSVSNQLIEANNYVIPYKIEKGAKESVYDLLKTITNLYIDYEMFFDENGRFIYQRVKNRYYADTNAVNNDVITYSFIDKYDVNFSYDINYHFDNVKNKIIVRGKLLEDGTQIVVTKENTDINSPFNINSNIGVRALPIQDNDIITEEQCDQRAKFEKWKHNDLNEQLSIQCLPLYFLDVNNIIQFDKKDIELSKNDRWLIDSISMGLGKNKSMSVTTHKIRPIG